MSDRYVPLHRTPRPNQPTSAEAEAEAIARLRERLTVADPALVVMVVRVDDLRALLDAHAALEAAHTEALDALEAWHAWQSTVQELPPDDLWGASCAVLAKAGRR